MTMSPGSAPSSANRAANWLPRATSPPYVTGATVPSGIKQRTYSRSGRSR